MLPKQALMLALPWRISGPGLTTLGCRILQWVVLQVNTEAKHSDKAGHLISLDLDPDRFLI